MALNQCLICNTLQSFPEFKMLFDIVMIQTDLFSKACIFTCPVLHPVWSLVGVFVFDRFSLLWD